MAGGGVNTAQVRAVYLESDKRPAGWDIFGVVKTLCDEVDRLRLIEEWAQGADHCPGCSGGYGDQYRCKCGRRDLFG